MELNAICELIVDCEHKTAPTQETGYPSIRTPNIGRGYFILEGVNRVSEDTYRLWTRRAIPQPGDLIMAREAPVGNVAMIPPDIKPCLGQRTLLIRPDRSNVEPAFLNYFLNGPHVQELIQAKTNGVTVPHLNMEDVRTLELPELPPLPVQRRIAGILSAYDDLIENCRRRIRILEEMARALYREWFVEFRFPGHEKCRMVASPLGKIPEGWEVRKLDTVCLSIDDGDWIETKDQGGKEYRLIQISNIGIGRFIETGNLRFITQETFNRLRCNEITPGDILVARMPTPIGRAWLATKMQWRMITAVDVAIIRTQIKALHPIYLTLAWNDDINLKRIAAQASGTTRPRVTRRELEALYFLIPPNKLQLRLVKIIEPQTATINSLSLLIQNLSSTRDLLLPRLMLI
jgi:type I restriction enzyme, S subunit